MTPHRNTTLLRDHPHPSPAPEPAAGPARPGSGPSERLPDPRPTAVAPGVAEPRPADDAPRAAAPERAAGAPCAADGAVGRLVERVLAGAYGLDPAAERVAVAFATSQAVRHDGRSGGYRNEVLSLRVGKAVGSCAVEPGQLPPLEEYVGATVAELLARPVPQPVRIAALDAFLALARPHTPANGARDVPVPGGSSIERSRARAAAVVGLVPATARRVLVVGVVNSLLECLRERGTAYAPCDLKGGRTEWGEEVHRDAVAELADCDAMLVSGMTLGNGSFETFAAHARRTATPLVMFAQTGSAVLPQLLHEGVTAVSAEPYPFFWLDGNPGTIHLYGGPR
ncbi:Rossmann-like domain-containing protein [Kitasatospora sp. NPDC051853]|uniref:Rossmann-like domain-containing protein n=1 Tax=Kitasatospora sp. NPDC051853 TaxID=3364058 RepID=UPI0037BDA844